MSELAALLESAASGTARLAILRGDPGIGKSRLGEELLAQARARKIASATARCWETPGAPPYWPWLQLLEELGLDAPQLKALLTGEDASIPSELRQSKVSSLAVRLLRAALSSPHVVVFEDLHAADLPTLRLLLVVVRSLKAAPVLWLLTARQTDPRLTPEVEAALGKLAREGVLIAPPALTQEQVGELARAFLGEAASTSVIAQVASSTEGTPLFVEGTLRLIASHGLPLKVPPSAVDVLRDRLNLLPQSASEALELAAVIGRTFSRELLARATGQTSAQLDGLLAPAIEAGVLKEETADALSFSHALLREAQYQSLPARRRAEHHLRTFGALRSLGANLEELAHHAVSALPLGSEEEAIELVRAAGLHAQGALAFGRAAELYERALAVLDVHRATARRADLWLWLSEAHAKGGQGQKAIAAANRAAADARELSDADWRSRPWPRERCSAWASSTARSSICSSRRCGGWARSAPICRRFSARAWRVRCSPRMIHAFRCAWRWRRSRARARWDPRRLKRALHFGLSAMGDVTDASERVPLLEELAELAVSTRDRVLEHRTRARLAMALLEAGDFPAAEKNVQQLEQLSAALGPSWRVRPMMFRRMRAEYEGRFDDAERLGEEIAQWLELDDSTDASAAEFQNVFRLALRARYRELLASVESVRARLKGTPMEAAGQADILLAFISAYSGDREGAGRWLAAIPRAALVYPDSGMLFEGGRVSLRRLGPLSCADGTPMARRGRWRQPWGGQTSSARCWPSPMNRAR